MYVTQCGIFSDSLIVVSMSIFSVRNKMKLYEGGEVIDIFEDLLVPLGYLT